MFRFLIFFLIFIAITSCVSENAHKDYNSSQTTAAINVELGLRYIEQNDLMRAKEKLLRALSEAPDLPIANAAMGYYLLTVGENDLAAEYYNRALHLAKEDPEIQNHYGIFLCRTGQKHEAIAYFLKAAHNPHYLYAGEAYENAALCARTIPDLEQASRYFALSAKINPSIA